MKAQLRWISVESKCFFRNFPSVFFTLVFPPLLLFVFGEIYGNEPLPLFNGMGTMDASVPAYICMVICVTGIMSLPLSLTGYREKKILKRFKATPTSPIQIIAAQIIVNFFMSVIGSLLLVFLAELRYNISFSGNLFHVILAYVLSVLSIFSIGFFIASFIKNSKAATAIANVIYFPMLFLSGATIPIETMSETIKSISNYIPLTHAVVIMKATWHGASLLNYKKELIILSAISVVCIFLSSVCFKWDTDNA